MGNTKRVIRVSHLTFSSRHLNVTGRVAVDEPVPMANTMHSVHFRIKVSGFLRVVIAYMAGIEMKPCRIRPTMTVTMYMPSRDIVSPISSMMSNFSMISDMIPMGEKYMANRTIRITV